MSADATETRVPILEVLRAMTDMERIELKIDGLHQSLHSLHRKTDKLMENQADFDAKLAKLAPAIDQVKTDFEAYKAAAAAKGVDLSAEGATLDTSITALSNLHTEVAGG